MIWRAGEDPKTLRDCVRRGGVLGLPTESSYALGVDPTSQIAIARVFAAKGRSATEPLGVVVADERQAQALGVDIDSAAFRAGLEFWPAALNVLVEVRRPLPAMSGAELLAVRIPDHSELRALLLEVGSGLTATSANLSGQPPFLDPDGLDVFLGSRVGAGEMSVEGMREMAPDVPMSPAPGEAPEKARDEGRDEARILSRGGRTDAPNYLVVDGGELPGGAPSTMVIWDNGSFRVLRQGRTNV